MSVLWSHIRSSIHPSAAVKVAEFLILQLSFVFWITQQNYIWWPQTDRTEYLIGFVCRWRYPTSSSAASPRREENSEGRHHAVKKRKRQSSQKINYCCTIIQTSYNCTTWFGIMFTSASSFLCLFYLGFHFRMPFFSVCFDIVSFSSTF